MSCLKDPIADSTALAENYGTGQRSYEVTFDELRNFDLSIYIWELGYCIGMMFIKISILTYYQRLQPSRIYQWTLGVVVAGSIAILVAQICQCWPIQNAWNPSEGPHRGTSKSCVNDVALTFFAAVFTIVTDFWIWACCLKMLKSETSTRDYTSLYIYELPTTLRCLH